LSLGVQSRGLSGEEMAGTGTRSEGIVTNRGKGRQALGALVRGGVGTGASKGAMK